MSSNANSKGIIAAAAAANSPTSDRRRSSASSAKFAGLSHQKRTSLDATAEARRQSFVEQNKAPGFIGQMWHNFTKK